MSLYALERLPDAVGQRLANTSKPIGRILVDHGLSTNREASHGRSLSCGRR